MLITAQESICIKSLLRIFTALKGKDETRNVNKQLLLLFFSEGPLLISILALPPPRDVFYEAIFCTLFSIFPILFIAQTKAQQTAGPFPSPDTVCCDIVKYNDIIYIQFDFLLLSR